MRLFLIMVVFLMSFFGSGMVSAADDTLWILRYSGFADAGRIEMIVSNRGSATVRYTKHPMVLSDKKPWSKQLDIGKVRVTKLFLLCLGQDFLGSKSQDFKSVPLMPGMDVTESSISLSAGKSPPKKQLSYVEVPNGVEPVISELKVIYEAVKNSK